MKKTGLTPPKFIKNMTIKRRFTLSVLIVVFLVMSIVGYLRVMSTDEEIAANMQTKIDTTLELAALSLSDPLWNFNDNGMRAICDAMFKDRDVGLVVVKTSSGREIYQKHLSSPIYATENLVLVEQTIVKNKIVLGSVTIGLTNYYNDLTRQKELVTIGSAILAMSFILWLLIAFVSNMVTKPIYELSTGTEEIAKGNLDKRLEIDYEDEIGGLARKFNSMAENLTSMMKELEVKNTSLLAEIGERKQAQSALAASEEKFFKAFRYVADIIGIVRISDGRYIEINDAFTSVLGYDKNEVIGHTSRDFGLWQNVQQYVDSFELLRSQGGFRDLEVTWRCKSGEIRIGLYSAEVIEIGGEACNVYVWHDITERKQTEEELRYLSEHDTLTGIYNRNYFEQELKRYESEYSGSLSVAVIMADTDGLKLINDTLGHAAGDQLLIATANLITQVIRPGDMVARIGGDEFAVILPDSSEEIVEALIEKIRNEFNAYNQKHLSIPISVSLGYSIKESANTSMKDLVKEADDAMYREKLHHSQSSHSAIVQTVMKLLEERDFVTEEHSERLQGLVENLANEIKLPEHRIADLKLLAKFHDIGKVGIPDSVLKKAGALSDVERQEIERHPEVGFRIAQLSSELMPIASWILKHQERWDGKGYPLRLKGEEIPLEDRIIAIADTYDAMTSTRPYRQALSHDTALGEIKRNAGIQFDPQLVDAFITSIEKNKQHINENV